MKDSQISREKMTTSGTNYSHSDLVMDALEVMHWASNRQLQIWLRGFATPRYSTLEITLKRLVDQKRIRVATYSGRKQGVINVYALRRKTRNFDNEDKLRIYHGLACTECLIRFYRSSLDLDGEILPERFFRGLGSVPEWGLRIPQGETIKDPMLLLCEFGTKSNVMYHDLMSGKLNAYNRNLERIQNKFSAKAVVVFVLDVPRETIARRMKEWNPKGPYRFVDFQSFAHVDMQKENQFDTPIYIYPDGSVGTL